MIARLLCTLAAAGCLGPAAAVPIVPAGDDQVIETLPAGGARREEREMRRQLAREPGDARLAVEVAGRLLAHAREQGDARFAGQALATLSHWPDAAGAPGAVLLMQATVLQFLHRFDDAAHTLDALLQREPRHAQAWLTLATIRRVQGRYADSDAACARLQASGAALHAVACRAENDALRGRFAQARSALDGLLAAPHLDGTTRNWLLTTRAELAVRAGDAARAAQDFAAALAAAPDDYTRLAFADFLADQGRDGEALALLRPMVRSDAVVLRLAIVGARAGASEAAADAREMRDRVTAANLRPLGASGHAREQALFALRVARDPARALALARANVQLQREPIDLLLLAQAARAADDGAARREVRDAVTRVGLRDVRVDALL